MPATTDLEALKNLLAEHPGSAETLFKIKGPEKDTVFKAGLRVKVSPSLEKAIKEKFNGSLRIV